MMLAVKAYSAPITEPNKTESRYVQSKNSYLFIAVWQSDTTSPINNLRLFSSPIAN